MIAIVIGCGRVGAGLGVRLTAEGHDVRIVDSDPDARRLLPAGYAGTWCPGNGFNRAVLIGAGVEHADAFVAVTSGDNANIVAARVAKDVYHVPKVIARIYEPRRAHLYRQLGIPTISSVAWSVGQIHRMLVHRHLEPELLFGNGETLLVRSGLPSYLCGRPLTDLDLDGEIRVIEVTRKGRSFLPGHATVAEPDDIVTFAVTASALQHLRGFLNRELGT